MKKQKAFLDEIARYKNVLEEHEEYAKEYLEARRILEQSKRDIEAIDQRTFAEMKHMMRPPKKLENVITGVLILVGMKDTSWRSAKLFMNDPKVKKKLLEFDPKNVSPPARRRATKWLEDHAESFEEDNIYKVNRAAVPLARWVKGIISIVSVFTRLEEFEDGERIIAEIEEASEKIAEYESDIHRVQELMDRWQEILDLLELDINS
eukprot:TRINITY_DN878_c0_g1_i1.p1 TRINITY_DN878_c0_g1~~TRINITY_DN878_c0_g1_i1.p1  ORF type:complete len:207 (+),score=44.71 TRINITY_DN878_c0_g1_i1:255-875(+)